MKNKKIDMLNGPLVGKIVIFALPLALSSILQQLFNFRRIRAAPPEESRGLESALACAYGEVFSV